MRRIVVTRSVVCDASGVSQIERAGDKEVTVRLGWEEITAVHAYKNDCYTVDLIRVAVSDKSGRMSIDASEEDAGYRELIGALPQYLPGCKAPEEWCLLVAFPAFAMQLTVLYRRDK